MSAMRVMVVDPSFSGGGYVHNLCNALAGQGLDVELVTSPHFVRSSRNWKPIKYVPRVWFYRLTQMRSYARGPLRPLWQALRAAGHNWTMWRVLRAAKRFDVVHAHHLPTPFVDLHWMRRVAGRAVLVLTVHNLYPHDSRRSARMRRLLRELYLTCDQLLVHADTTRDGLVQDFGIAADRITKVAFGNYHHMIGKAETEAPRTCIAGMTPPTILFFGEIRLNKGLDVLIDAAGLLRDRGMQFRVLVAGQPGVSPEPYRDQVRRRSLTDIVEFSVGYIEEKDVPLVFAQATVVALPYTSIDHSAVAITATSMGRALVASDLAGLAELVRDARNGLLVPPSNADALATALARVLTDASLRETFEENSREHARRALDWEPIGRLTAAAYQRARISRVKGSSALQRSHSS